MRSLSSRSADLVFAGGTILTLDARGRRAEALAVAGDRIVAIGAYGEVREAIGSRTRIVDLTGGAVLPGINDSHLHAGMLGAYWPNLWLDAVLATGKIGAPRPLTDGATRRETLRSIWKLLSSLGITSYTEPGLGPGAAHQHGGACAPAMLETYTELAIEGGLPVRVSILLLFGELDGPSNLAAFEDGLRAFSAPSVDPRWLRVAGVKIFADGIPPMRTAWLDQPYDDGSYGSLLVEGVDEAERLRNLGRMIELASTAGLQVGVHATGTRAIAETVRALGRLGSRPLRHYVIHGDLADPSSLEVMAHLGVGLNAQPEIASRVRPALEAVLGKEHARRGFPLRHAIDAGVPVCLSSDSPVASPDWRRGVAAAVRGWGDTDARGKSNALTIEEALRGYTINPARQDGAESWKGSLEVGKVADLCVVDLDPLVLSVEEIERMRVTMTVVGGRVVFEDR